MVDSVPNDTLTGHIITETDYDVVPIGGVGLVYDAHDKMSVLAEWNIMEIEDIVNHGRISLIFAF